MRTHTLCIGSIRHVPVLLVLCCVSAVADAEMVLHDNWARGGEVFIEGTGWRAAFSKADGAVVLAAGDQAVRIVPFDREGSEADGIVSCEAVPTNSKDETEVRAVFSAGEKRLESLFHLTYKGTLRITPGQSTHGVFVRSPIAVGVLPGEQLEDVLYRPERYPDLPEVHVPAENWFAGLLQGNNGIVACAWPEGEQSLSLMLGGAGGPGRMFEALKIVLDGKDLYLEVLAGPAIWHKEKLQLGYLERDVVIEWEKPFPATYKTQLLLKGETTTPRTFVFRNRPNTQWRPEMGECAWPVWFEGDRACLRLGKKIPPRGDAIIFPMADGDKSLTGFLRRTPLAGIIARRNERAELPQGPRNAPNVGFVACGGTGVMRNTIFALGLQKREKEFLTEYADFLADYVTIVQTRHAGFFRSIDETRKKLVAWLEKQNNPEVHEYLEQMSVQAGRVEDGLRRKMELYGANTPEAHIAHADRAADRLKELLDTGDPEVFPECNELINTLNILAWGHAESAGMRFSMLAREWAQNAALACADNPAACEYARGIRASIRDALNGAPPW